MLIVLSCFFSVSVLAQLQTEKTVSRELTVTTSEAARPYILFKATSDAIKQYSTELGYNYDSLIKKLDEKFLAYFEQYKDRKLAEKFGKQYSTQLTGQQKEEFLKGLEDQREIEYLKFSRFLEILDGYTVKNIQVAADNPKLWTGIVDLKLNSTRLKNLVARIESDTQKQYSKILFITEMNLVGLTWTDLGLEKSTSFTDPLADVWDKWMNANLPNNVEESYICREDCLTSFVKWQEMPQDEGLIISSELINSLWLKTEIHLRKISFKETLNEWTLEWSGSVVLLDANTKRVLLTYSLPASRKTWRGLNQKELNSQLAGLIYRSALPFYQNFVQKLPDIPQLNRLGRLVIKGHRNLGDVLSLMNLLRETGKSIELELQLDLFNLNEAELLYFHQGEEKTFSDLLSRLKELKSSNNYNLVNEFNGVHHVIKLITE